jgi:hypothetical protein
VRDVVPRMPKNYWYSLIDIGNVINQLMGGGFKSSYTRRRFRRIYLATTTTKTAGGMRLGKPSAKVSLAFANSPSLPWNLNLGNSHSNSLNTSSMRENGDLKQEGVTNASYGQHLSVPGCGGGGLQGLQSVLSPTLSPPSVASHESYQSSMTPGQTAIPLGGESMYGASDQFFDRFANIPHLRGGGSNGTIINEYGRY